MELRELRSFCTAAKLRSISKAAEQLGVGQPTVTTHVKKLEDELGTVLFDRIKRPIQLTLAGARLAELAAPLVDGIEALGAMTSLAEEAGVVIAVKAYRELREQELRPLLHDRVGQLRQPFFEDGPTFVEYGVAVSLDDLRGPFDVPGCQGVFEGLIHQALVLEPLAGPAMQLNHHFGLVVPVKLIPHEFLK